MSAFVKSKLKAARDALGKNENEKARDAALGVLEYEPDNPNAYVCYGFSFHLHVLIVPCPISHVFLGAAYLRLEDFEKSEQVTGYLGL